MSGKNLKLTARARAAAAATRRLCSYRLSAARMATVVDVPTLPPDYIVQDGE